MKKIYFMFLFLIFMLVSCNNLSNTSTNSSSEKISRTSTNTTNSGVIDSTSTTKPDISNIAVIYFSATNHTKIIAEYISEYYSCEIIEIEAKIEYTSDDLNYNNSNSRVVKEHNDSSIRPELKNNIDVSNYDYIYLGYPIWWGEAPNILYTFVENTNLSGKNIYPFCTSASSSLGSSASNLSKKSNGTFLEGHRFRSNDSASSVTNWLDTHNLKK